jgi:HlyD family secretion protein
VVRAPFAGVVALVDAEVGEVVSPSSGGGSNARGSLITLVDMLSIEAQVELPQANLAGISLEMPATIVLDAYPAQPYAGRVTRIWPEANRQKATIELRVTIHAPDARLKPELGVRVIFAAQESPATAASPEAAPGLGVPEQAIVRDEGRDKIWRVERGVARLVLVEVTRRVSGLAHIARGLVEGDEVITDPPARLTDGDRVRTLR